MVTRVMQGGSGTLLSESAFPAGSTVEFKTALGGGRITGQVVCFDAHLKILAIKEMGSGKPVLRMFNLTLISEIREVSAPTEEVSDFLAGCSINNNQDRACHAEEKKKEEMMHENISLDGQKAFLSLRHVLNHVKWNGSDIEVLKAVVVKPPYKAENAELLNDDEKSQRALIQIQKILSKPFVGERRLTPCYVDPDSVDHE